MEYNTKRTKMIMICQALNMKDRDKRNSFARRIIKIMEEKNPKIKCIPNFHHKLWDQLFIMSEFKLKPNTGIVHIPFRKVSYPEYLRDYRYYGKIVREIIRVASDY